METSYEQLAKEDLRNFFDREPNDSEVNDWVEEMLKLLESIEIGKEYIILDGKIIDSTETNLNFKGWFAFHQFEKIPQVEAINNFEVIHDCLTNVDYWTNNEIEVKD